MVEASISSEPLIADVQTELKRIVNAEDRVSLGDVALLKLGCLGKLGDEADERTRRPRPLNVCMWSRHSRAYGETSHTGGSTGNSYSRDRSQCLCLREQAAVQDLIVDDQTKLASIRARHAAGVVRLESPEVDAICAIM